MSATSVDQDTPDLTPFADCNLCSHKDTLFASGACKPGDCCVRAESGRQIDRFFKAHPGFAPDYAQDPFWERRAIAARYLPSNRLEPMLTDPDEAVRRVLAYRVPLEWLLKLVNDIDREVRVTVADRLPENQLELMADDPDYLVRAYVAKRLPKGRLFRLVADPDTEVRRIVAERIPQVSLGLLANDTEVSIRRIVVQRMDIDDLYLMKNDSDWTVRYEVALRAQPDLLEQMLSDGEEEVRETARQRRTSLLKGEKNMSPEFIVGLSYSDRLRIATEARHRAVGACFGSELALLTSLMGPMSDGPEWPAGAAWLGARHGKNACIISDGLSDPWVERDRGDTGLGIEVFIESPDTGLDEDAPLNALADTWLFPMLAEISHTLAGYSRLSEKLLAGVLLSLELNIDHIKDGRGQTGVLLSMPDLSTATLSLSDMGEVRLIAATLLTPAELRYLRGKGEAGRRELAEKLQAAGIGHLSLLHRPSLV